MPRMTRSERRRRWKHVETLVGMSEEDRHQFSWDCLEHFFRVTLWDKSHLCAYEFCTYSGNVIKTIQDATLDHKLPRALGGRTRLANLQLMHARCNSKKGKRLIGGWPPNWRKLQTPVDSRSGLKRMSQ